MTIKLSKISSIADPNAAVYVAHKLEHVQTICALIRTSDTVWSTRQLAVIRDKAAKGELNCIDNGTEVKIILRDATEVADMLVAGVTRAKAQRVANFLCQHVYWGRERIDHLT